MSSNPYENEPGFEDANEPSDKKHQKEYVQKVNADLQGFLGLVSDKNPD